MKGLHELFAQNLVNDAIPHLVKAEHLTLVVGAGVSAEAGLPTWPMLIQRLLESLGSRHGLSGEDLEQFCSWTMEAEGLTGAAAIVESNLEESDFRRWVREELYRDAPTLLVPGPSARACAKLKGLLGDRCEVVTTNYDPVLRNAFNEEDSLKHLRIRACTDDRPAASEEAIVRHLHGFMTQHKTFGDIVLSEGHYHAMQGSESAWQEPFMRQRLTHSPCLFVGTSLTDPNLLRYLYRTSGSTQHLALFTRQQEAAQRRYAKNSAEKIRDSTLKERWERLGVRPLLADYYADNSQFLWELIWQLEEGENLTSHSQRLYRWETTISNELMPTRAKVRFRNKQDELQGHLSSELERLLQSLAADGVEVSRGERLGMHLWVYLPSNNALLLIGASDRAWRDASTLSPVPVDWDTMETWASVQAFCSGGLAIRSTVHQSTTRWNHVVGIPLFSSEPPWGHLPLGVLTVASTVSGDKSVLGRGLEALRGISWRLSDRAAALLTPPDGYAET